jgi:hypothetical protein
MFDAKQWTLKEIILLIIIKILIKDVFVYTRRHEREA